MVTIKQKIVAVSVVTKDPSSIKLNSFEPISRLDELPAMVYKIKPPEHIQTEAIYITITNAVFPDGSVRPFELFINSRNESSMMWVSLVSRLTSAIWRQNRDSFPIYSIQEFMQSQSSNQGYFLIGGGYVKSIAHHIGLIIEGHVRKLGLLTTTEMDSITKKVLEKKRVQADLLGVKHTLCIKCNETAVARLDNCDTCLSCGYSKCG